MLRQPRIEIGHQQVRLFIFKMNTYMYLQKLILKLFYYFLAFPGILNWQKRLWLTIIDFQNLRNNASTSTDEIKSIIDANEFKESEMKLYDSRNYFSSGVTFNYKYSHQLSVAISKMQGLTNAIRVSV